MFSKYISYTMMSNIFIISDYHAATSAKFLLVRTIRAKIILCATFVTPVLCELHNTPKFCSTLRASHCFLYKHNLLFLQN